MLFQILERAKSKFSHRIAIETDDSAATYSELFDAASGISGSLNIHPGQAIAVLAAKGIPAISAVWGILRAGGVHISLNPMDPPGRLAATFRESGARILLHTGDLASKAESVVKVAGRGQSMPLEIGGGRPAGIQSSHEDLAYLFATSGSTGRPKLVQVEHGSIQAFVGWSEQEFGFSAADRVASLAPLFFDLSLLDIFVTASCGATLVIPKPGTEAFPISLARWLNEKHITSIYLVPTLLARLADQPMAFPEIKRVLFAGEVLSPTHLPALFARFPSAVLANLYGPTETNVCAFHKLDRTRDYTAGIPIGHPCPYNELWIVNEHNEAEGEICVKGENVMRGYAGQDPLSGAYCTGDWARREENGELFFLGRRDDMIKLNGYRISPGEIGNAYMNDPRIKIACAFAFTPAGQRQPGIGLAYVGPGAPLPAADLFRIGHQLLPRYMIPSRFFALPNLPQTATGKIDVKCLAQMAAQTDP